MSYTAWSPNPISFNGFERINDGLAGHGSPEGIIVGWEPGQLWTDLDTDTIYFFAGTIGLKDGWVASQ